MFISNCDVFILHNIIEILQKMTKTQLEAEKFDFCFQLLSISTKLCTFDFLFFQSRWLVASNFSWLSDNSVTNKPLILMMVFDKVYPRNFHELLPLISSSALFVPCIKTRQLI